MKPTKQHQEFSSRPFPIPPTDAEWGRCAEAVRSITRRTFYVPPPTGAKQ